MKEGFSQAAYDKFLQDSTSATLKARGGTYGGGSETLSVDDTNIKAVDCRNATENEISGALQSNAARSLNGNGTIRVDAIVRRLTPLECERLQGFPDEWTNIDEEWFKGNVGKGTHRGATDSRRYKALGNSIAIPPWFYVLQKLNLCCGADHTMASLFDGIGGFPLIWEMLNGEGSCIWASEIEDFPIAVTKVRFPEE